MFKYIKFDLFLKCGFIESTGKTYEPKPTEQTKGPDLSQLSPENREKYESLKKEIENLKLGQKFVGGMESRLREGLIKVGDPKDKEYHEIASKVKKFQEELAKMGEKAVLISQELSKLLGEVKVENKKLSSDDVNKFKTIDNKEFLGISPENRLKYVTKTNTESKEVSSGNVKNLEFTFTFDGQFNRELYLKTTAGQVLPKEVGEVKVGNETYLRQNLAGEFFTPDNKRLIIQEGTQIEIPKIRNEKELAEIQNGNNKKVDEYLKNNPESNKQIVSESFKRGIDPKFAGLAFGDLIKNTPENQISQVLEDAFTEFDRYRGSHNISLELKDGKYSDKLAIGLFVQFSQDWKQKAKDYGISEEQIKIAETNGEVNMGLQADAIKNGDSLPEGGYLKGEKLLQNAEFSQKLDKVCSSIGANREDLIKIMKAESRLDPRTINRQSQATGLIQFMPKTAEGLGTSVGNIRSMTAVEQLDLVEKYFKQNSGGKSLSSIEKMYQAVFYPLSLSKEPGFVFGSEQSDSFAKKVADQNPGIAKFSSRSDGLIDGHAFSKYVDNHVSKLA